MINLIQKNENIIMKIPSLEEAQNRFPIGTLFNNQNLKCGCDNIEVTGTLFSYYESNSIIIDYRSCLRKGRIGTGYTIYKDGIWADIDYLPGNYEIY